MPEPYEMLRELRGLVDDEEICNDACEHQSPSDTNEYCNVCFIVNLSDHVSEQDPDFTEETTDKQRETIENLWDKYCN